MTPHTSATPLRPCCPLTPWARTTATVLDNVTLALNAGEVLALTGENGAGKSTLSKIICGLESATRGGMRLGGPPPPPRAAMPSSTACAW